MFVIVCMFVFEKVIFYSISIQEPFDGLAEKFNVLLTDEQHTIVDELFSTLPIEQTANFIELMFEFIILRIDIQEDQESEDYIDISNAR